MLRRQGEVPDPLVVVGKALRRRGKWGGASCRKNKSGPIKELGPSVPQCKRACDFRVG